MVVFCYPGFFGYFCHCEVCSRTPIEQQIAELRWECVLIGSNISWYL